MLTAADIRQLNQELRRGLSALYGERLRGLYLYGSYARGVAGPESDLDVAVVLDRFDDHWAEIKRSSDLVGDLSLRYGVSLSLYRIRAGEWDHPASPLVLTIREHGVPA